MLHSSILNTSQVCHQLGIRYAVMSPGSRNAPLTISFARNEGIEKFIIPDERTAGFVALGIAQKTNHPVVLCCTSGTALLNYAPAVAEAFYRQIPLVILSADRPPHLIDQRDGQTIRQFEVLKNHVKDSLQLPIVQNDDDGQLYLNQLAEGVALANASAKGPIHINVPFEEPFYPEKELAITFNNIILKNPLQVANEEISTIQFAAGKKILILVGQQNADQDLDDFLKSVQDRVPIIKSPLNNLQIDGINHTDLFLGNQPELVPDILITSGLSVLSKKLKNFLRNNKPNQHFHCDPDGVEVDTYDTSPQLIKESLDTVLKNIDFSNTDISYIQHWKKCSSEAAMAIAIHFENAPFSESSSANIVLKSLPVKSELHLGNSMPVRFADIFGIPPSIHSWCNRGTSGIDGCTSTAIGTSLVSKKLNILITGDVSFLYDRNAFFHQYKIPKLRIIIFNNQGGGIFRLIDGPSALPELTDYFETRHSRTAQYICLENGFEYRTANSYDELQTGLEGLYQESENIKILEIFTNPDINQKEYKKLKEYINEHISN